MQPMNQQNHALQRLQWQLDSWKPHSHSKTHTPAIKQTLLLYLVQRQASLNIVKVKPICEFFIQITANNNCSTTIMDRLTDYYYSDVKNNKDVVGPLPVRSGSDLWKNVTEMKTTSRVQYHTRTLHAEELPAYDIIINWQHDTYFSFSVFIHMNWCLAPKWKCPLNLWPA